MENQQHPYKPITCPRCGSRELAFVTEYHKSLFWRFVSILCIIPFIICLGAIVAVIDKYGLRGINNASEVISPIIIVSIVFLSIRLICKFVYLFVESRTHVQSVCKDCGKLFLLN